MSLAEILADCFRSPDGRPTSTIREEIRDELEFHLALAAEEKQRQGMKPDEAREAADRDFGDFATIETRCRRIQLGERSFLQRAQFGLVAATLALVVAIAFASYRNHEEHQSALQGMTRSLQQIRQDMDRIVRRAPPVVVETVPHLGATDVDPTSQEIRVTFSKAMTDRSWSWCRTDHPFPESVGEVRYVDDRTCVMPVHLDPDTQYVIQINSPDYQNFKDAEGRSAEPFLLSFTTGSRR